MLRFSLVPLLILLFSIDAIGQVFISEHSSAELIIGPNNIEGDQALIAAIYIDKLESFKEQLSAALANENKTIVGLENLGKLKRKDKNNFLKALSNKNLIEKEVLVIDSLLESWKAHFIFQESLKEAKELIEEGSCLEFTCKTGKFYSDELIIVSAEDAEYLEIIPVVNVPESTYWVKKKSNDNCTSPDPDDCLVWHMVNQKKGIKFLDINNVEHLIDDCPAEFKYDAKKEACLKSVALNAKDEGLALIKLILNSSNEILFPLSWQIVDCEN